jgi:hypothetical protein
MLKKNNSPAFVEAMCLPAFTGASIPKRLAALLDAKPF